MSMTFRFVILLAALTGGSNVFAQGWLPGMLLQPPAAQVPCSMPHRESVLAANLAMAQQWAMAALLQEAMLRKALRELDDRAAITSNLAEAKLGLATAGLEVAHQKIEKLEGELEALREENAKLRQHNADLPAEPKQ